MDEKPSNRVSDVSYTNFHIKDLATFGDCLTEAVNAAFPTTTGPSQYKSVHALLLSWEEDNLGVIKEVSELQHVFAQTYHFDTEEWKIPSAHSYKATRQQITRFLDLYEDKSALLIIYYGGHAYMNDDRQCNWSW